MPYKTILEYKTLMVDPPFSEDSCTLFNTLLADLGRDFWDLAATLPPANGCCEVAVVFKRETKVPV